MIKPINELEFKYTPEGMTSEEFKRLLSTTYNEALENGEEWLIKVIDLLKNMICNMHCENKHEWFHIGNMESNFRFALGSLRGEINEY